MAFEYNPIEVKETDIPSEDKSLLGKLFLKGYSCERVEVDGNFKGVRVLKDGKQIHETLVFSSSWEKC